MVPPKLLQVCAIAPGTSAIELAAQVKKYLKEPNKRFRRIKEKMEDGTIKWHLSKNAKAYHPGKGVYRSSARNAQRLARTEINMSYRTAEQERWKQFDFVVGYEIKTTQNGHHVEDICDDLAGKYPKTFKFTGWHPMCYDELSEVLTQNGWKRFKDVSYSDNILSLNPETRELEWVSIVDRQCYDFDGLMLRFFNDNLDCIVTPDHRMPYENIETGQISYSTAEEYHYTLGGFINGEKVFFKERVPYSGKVYDLTLERNHIMYIRRNGKCFWGSNCMCYCIPILKTEDEFWADDDDAKSVNEVTDMPQGFKDWIADNAERIDKATEKGTLPYFIRDNRKVVEDIKNGESDREETHDTNQDNTLETSANRVEEIANIIIKNGYHSSREAQMPPLNIGRVPSAIIEYANINQINLDSYDLYITTKGIEHTLRESKVSKGIAVTADELVDFVKNRNDYAIYYDPAKGDFIFATSKAKFIASPNYKMKINKEKKSVFNYISATRISNGLEEALRYFIKIKDAKQ